MTPKRTVLSNGMVLLTSEQRTLPMVSIELLMDAGSVHESAPQAGLANLTARLLTYGTKRRSALQINETLDFIGASLEAACGQDTASLSMTVLKKDLATGLELLADVLTQPTFPQAEIDRQKQAIIATIRATEENPGAVAGKAFAAAIFPQSPYGRPVEGTEATVKTLPATSDPSTLMLEVADGKEDVVLMDPLAASKFNASNPKKVVPLIGHEPFVVNKAGFAVLKGETELLNTLEEGLDAARNMGLIKIITDKYDPKHQFLMQPALPHQPYKPGK